MNEPIASGREADIFALDAGRVLRRYRRDADVTREAAVMSHVAAHGYPVPVVYAATRWIWIAASLIAWRGIGGRG